MHAGVSVGPDGATHQQLEDIALMQAQPNMSVIVPCDVEEARKATLASAFNGKPMYLRFGRSNTPIFTTRKSPFEIGKAECLWRGKSPQAAIIACGGLVYNALVAAKELHDEGISTVMLNNHTVKPMDRKAVVSVAKEAGAVVTVEEHQVTCGMGSSVANILAQEHPVPIEYIGVHDTFGQSGDPDELIEHYGMGVSHIKEAVKKVISRK